MTIRSTVLCVLVAAGAASAGNKYYANPGSNPWGHTTNEQAMDLAFGGGNWIQENYTTWNVGTVFSANTDLVYIDGSDGGADELENFLSANQGAVESWVAGGGCLFLNAAPNEGDGMSFGFGGVTLTYTDFGSQFNAVNGGHPIWNGPFLPAGLNYTGTSATHASVSGGGVTPLALSENNTTSLGELSWGSGHVLFGGMTTTGWWSPQPESLNARANMLVYACVPTPGAAGLLGLAGLAAARRRR